MSNDLDYIDFQGETGTFVIILVNNKQYTKTHV